MIGHLLELTRKTIQGLTAEGRNEETWPAFAKEWTLLPLIPYNLRT